MGCVQSPPSEDGNELSQSKENPKSPKNEDKQKSAENEDITIVEESVPKSNQNKNNNNNNNNGTNKDGRKNSTSNATNQEQNTPNDGNNSTNNAGNGTTKTNENNRNITNTNNNGNNKTSNNKNKNANKNRMAGEGNINVELETIPQEAALAPNSPQEMLHQQIEQNKMQEQQSAQQSQGEMDDNNNSSNTQYTGTKNVAKKKGAGAHGGSKLQPVPSQSISSTFHGQTQAMNNIAKRQFNSNNSKNESGESSTQNNENNKNETHASSHSKTNNSNDNDSSNNRKENERNENYYRSAPSKRHSKRKHSNNESDMSENEETMKKHKNKTNTNTIKENENENDENDENEDNDNENDANDILSMLDPAIADALKHTTIEDKARIFQQNKERMNGDRDFIVSKLQPSRFLKLPKNLKSFFPAHHSHCDVRQLFHIRRALGQGVTGKVYKAIYREKTVALKAIRRSKKWGEYLFAQETQLLMSLDHPNVVQLTDIFCDEHYFYMISEMGQIDLADYREDHEFTDQQLRTVIKQILSGVAYLHQNDIAHRDLKPENVVYAQNKHFHPLLIDFGDAIHVENDSTYDEFVGTPSYLAPERFNPHKGWQLKQSDVWAVGIITYELIVGRHCFDGRDQNSIFAKIKKNKWSWPNDVGVSSLCRDFVKKCLTPDAGARLTALQALTHPWITFDETRRQSERQERRRRRKAPKVSIPDASATSMTGHGEISPTQSYSRSVSAHNGANNNNNNSSTPQVSVQQQQQHPQAQAQGQAQGKHSHHHHHHHHNRRRHHHKQGAKQGKTAQSHTIQASASTNEENNKHKSHKISSSNDHVQQKNEMEKGNATNNNKNNKNDDNENDGKNKNQLQASQPTLQSQSSNASDPGIKSSIVKPSTDNKNVDASSRLYNAVNDESDTEYQQSRQFFSDKHLSFSAQSASIGSPSQKGLIPTSQFLSPVLHNKHQSNQSYSHHNAGTAGATASVVKNGNNNNNGYQRPRAYSEHKTNVPTSLLQSGQGRQLSHGGYLTGPNTPQQAGMPGGADRLPTFGNLAFSNSSISAVSVSSVSLSARLSNPDLVSLFSKLAPTVPGTRFQHLLASGYKATMTEEGIKAAKQEFDMMDRDKDGYITCDDLISLFTEAENMSPNEAAAIARIIIDQLDLTKNNKINFDEFVQSKVTRSFSRSAYDLFDELLQNTRSFSANAGVLDGTNKNENNNNSKNNNNNNNNGIGGNMDVEYYASDYEDGIENGDQDEIQYTTDYATDDNNDVVDEKVSASPGMAPIHETANENENSTSRSNHDNNDNNDNSNNHNNDKKNNNKNEKKKSGIMAGSSSIGATLPVIDAKKQSNISPPMAGQQTPSVTMSATVSNNNNNSGFKMHNQELTLEHILQHPVIKKLNIPNDMIKQYFSEIDKSGSGKITYQQFMSAVTNQPITDVIVDIV